MTRRTFAPGGALWRLAYNPCMFHALQQLVGTAVMERLTLLLNHVIAAEPIATQRLRPHAGRCIRFHLQGWPSLLPTPPALVFGVTPAGLVEWLAEQAPAEADLTVTIDAANPARSIVQGLAGRRPPVEIAGDAGFATDVSWLMDNLRWDLQDDLARLVGQGPAGELGRLARAAASGLRDTVAAWTSRARGAGVGGASGGTGGAPGQPPR